MKKLATANQKGGVGKSMLTIHLAIYLAEMGKKVGVIDNDPQGNAAMTLKMSSMTVSSEITAYDLYDDDIDPESVGAGEGITVLEPGDKLPRVARFESDAADLFVDNVNKMDGLFDVLLIDNPPTTGIGLVSALLSVDYVMCPVEADFYSIGGIAKLSKQIRAIQNSRNPALENLGYVVNRFDRRSEQQKEALAKLKKAQGKAVIDPPITLRTAFQKSLITGIPVWNVKPQGSSAREGSREMKKVLSTLVKKMGIKP